MSYRWNQTKADELIPDYMQGGLRGWIEQGIWPGGFLTAVLTNDLKEACGRADSTNIAALPNYVQFLFNYAPSGCWGSREKADKWAAMHEAELTGERA
jgi:hypothetical protein